MDPKALQAWLEAHLDDIFSFMDYEATLDSPQEFSSTMAAWFNNPGWDDGAARFDHLGIDGTGSQLAAWTFDPDQPPCVVFFGSEGGRGVLTSTLEGWAHAIAHAPAIDEYPSFEDDLPACLSEEGNWRMEDEDEESQELAREALTRYSGAVIDAFGQLSSLKEAIGDVAALNARFEAWVVSRVG